MEPTETASSNQVQNTQSRIRVHFCDGIRGLASLYVVFYHSINIPREFPSIDKSIAWWFGWMDHGYAAVSVFIVLSGFCLMLPVIRTAEFRIQGELRSYFQRRARRILPPYFASLLICLLLHAVMRIIFKNGGTDTTGGSVFTPGNILSHVFLVHNLVDEWARRINSTMWSVATEWQIYFLFPLLLLPVWRKFGAGATIVVGLALGFIPHFLFPKSFNLESARFWYVGLFAMGAAAAYVAYSTNPKIQAIRSKMPWGFASCASVIICIGVIIGTNGKYDRLYWALEPMIGAATAVFLVWCSLAAKSGTRSHWIVGALESRYLVALGLFSYSLYLTHQPLHIALMRITNKLHFGVSTELAFRLVVFVPLAMIIGYAFHLAFEKRFMSSPRSSQTQLSFNPIPTEMDAKPIEQPAT